MVCSVELRASVNYVFYMCSLGVNSVFWVWLGCLFINFLRINILLLEWE